MKKWLLTGFCAAVLAAGAMTAEAREFRAAPAAPPAHPANGALYQSFAKFLPEESGGALTAKILGPEIVDLRGMKTALQSQVAEVGNLLPLYFPAELPNTAMAGDLALLGRNPQAMGAAMTEYVVTCPECQEEFKRFGGVFAGAGSSDVYVLLTTRPVRTLADLKGMRLRSGGAPYSRWAEAAGATPVNIQVNDTFESLSQGVIDGSMASIADLTSFRLIELVKHVTDLKLGTYHTTSNFTVALPVWQDMSEDERRAFIRAANRANTVFTESWGYTKPGIAIEEAKKAGIEFIEPAQDLVAFTEEFVQKDLATAAEVAASKFNVTDASAKIERFRGLVDKWTKIAEENGNDPAKMAEAMQREVWDKIDYAAYGL